jgi:hypothetical protein
VPSAEVALPWLAVTVSTSVAGGRKSERKTADAGSVPELVTVIRYLSWPPGGIAAGSGVRSTLRSTGGSTGAGVKWNAMIVPPAV